MWIRSDNPWLKISGWFKKRMEINQKRLSTFKTACQKYKYEVAYEDLRESSDHYVFLEKLKVMGCIINKGSLEKSTNYSLMRYIFSFLGTASILTEINMDICLITFSPLV